MTRQRTFDVVLISKDKPVGFSLAPHPDKTVRYDGAPVSLKF
jgi:hypothetical protein